MIFGISKDALSRTSFLVLIIGALVTVLISLLENQPWRWTDSTTNYVMIMFWVLSPFLLLLGINGAVSTEHTKTWIIFILSALVTLSTVFFHLYLTFVIPDDPQHAPASVLLVLLPFIQLFGCGFLGIIGWLLASSLAE